MACVKCGGTTLQVAVLKKQAWAVHYCTCGCLYRMTLSAVDAAECLAARAEVGPIIEEASA